MIVKNISNIEYFLKRADVIDISYRYHVKYHPEAPISTFDSPQTFVAEFRNCRVNNCPLLITENGEMITEHVWPLLHTNTEINQKKLMVCGKAVIGTKR